jgi:hypothetical protein
LEHVFVSLCLSLTNEPSLSFPPHVCAHSAIPAKRSGGNEPRSGICQSKSAVSGDPYAVGARWVGVGNDGLRVMMLNVCGMLGKQPECFCGTSVGNPKMVGAPHARYDMQMGNERRGKSLTGDTNLGHSVPRSSPHDQTHLHYISPIFAAQGSGWL